MSHEAGEEVFFSFPCGMEEFEQQKMNFYMFIRILATYLLHKNKHLHQKFNEIIEVLCREQEETNTDDITFLRHSSRTIMSEMPMSTWNIAYGYYLSATTNEPSNIIKDH